MRDNFTLALSRHQANVLNSALSLARQITEIPPGRPVYNLHTEGIEATLVKDEFTLIQEEVARQLEEQDKQ
jgi:hypothetical protein